MKFREISSGTSVLKHSDEILIALTFRNKIIYSSSATISYIMLDFYCDSKKTCIVLKEMCIVFSVGGEDHFNSIYTDNNVA